jgi:hypothetical protein
VHDRARAYNEGTFRCMRRASEQREHTSITIVGMGMQNDHYRV